MTDVKTWGPFTGRQLTTIICVVAVAALFPVGAWAVSGSNSFITDASTGSHASVDSSGQLKVVGNVAGPKSWVASNLVLLTNNYTPRVTPPAGKAFVLRQIHLDWFGVTASADPWFAWAIADPACGTIVGSFTEVVDLPNDQDSRVVTFDPGWIVPAGKALCAVKSGTGSFQFKAFGYYVASSAVGAAASGAISATATPKH